jgi:hypothetical protein
MEAAHLIAALNNFQKSQSIRGDLFEIGVHHGKLTILLGLLLGENEKLAVCDIFEDQSFNVSGSGAGSKDIFLEHWQHYFGDTTSLIIHDKPSQELTAADTGENVRIFSIDGGHTAAETYGDLVAAKQALLPEGLILIDDYFDPVFPGVSEGVNRFLFDNPDIKPLMHFFNKLVLFNEAGLRPYEEFLRSPSFSSFMEPRRLTYTTQMFHGIKLYTFGQSGRKQVILRKIRKVLPATAGLKLTGLRHVYSRLIRPRR